MWTILSKIDVGCNKSEWRPLLFEGEMLIFDSFDDAIEVLNKNREFNSIINHNNHFEISRIS